MSETIEEKAAASASEVEHKVSPAKSLNERLQALETPHYKDENVEFTFKLAKGLKGSLDKDGKPLTEEALAKLKRPPVTLTLPVLTQEGLLAAMQDDKTFNYVVDTINEQIREAARSQVAPATDDVTPVNRQSELDLSKLTLSYLVNQPPSERKGGGISKETWAEFEKDYIATMDAIKSEDGTLAYPHKNNVYAANLFVKRLEPIKNNKPMLKKLQSRISIWAGNTENGDELMEVYKFLDSKIENLLTKDDEDQLNSI
ncbi:unnamed protein product [Sphagnum tenellum]